MFLLIISFLFCIENKDKAYYHYSIGEKNFFEGNFIKSVENFKTANIYDKTSIDIKVKLAATYKELNNNIEALKILEEVYKNTKKHILNNELYIEILVSENNFDKALEVCNETLKENNLNRVAVLYKSIILIEKQENKAALVLLNEYTKSESDDELAYHYIGSIYLSENNFKQAEESFLKAVYINSDYKPAIFALINIYVNHFENNIASTKLKKLKKISRKNSLIQNKLVNLYLELAQDEKNTKKAKIYFKKAIEELKEIEEDSDINAKLKISLIYISLEEYQNAKKTLNSILEKDKNNDNANYYLANIYYLEKDFNKAVATYSLIDARSYLFTEAINSASKILIEAKKIEEAIELIKSAIIKHNHNPDFYNTYANLLNKNNNRKEAIKTLEKASKLFLEDENILYQLGLLYFEEKQTDKAVKIMNKIIEINFENPYALNFVAYNLIEKEKDLNLAESYAFKALEFLPDDPYINDTVGWYYFKIKDYESALVYLEKAVSILRNQNIVEAEISEHLALTYEFLGFKEKRNDIYKLLLSNSNVDINKKKQIEAYLENERIPSSNIINIE